MAVARVTEISSTSTKSFEDAIQQGVARATKTLRNVQAPGSRSSASISAMEPSPMYQVNLMVTFILDD